LFALIFEVFFHCKKPISLCQLLIRDISRCFFAFGPNMLNWQRIVLNQAKTYLLDFASSLLLQEKIKKLIRFAGLRI